MFPINDAVTQSAHAGWLSRIMVAQSGTPVPLGGAAPQLDGLGQRSFTPLRPNASMMQRVPSTTPSSRPQTVDVDGGSAAGRLPLPPMQPSSKPLSARASTTEAAPLAAAVPASSIMSPLFTSTADA
jgi:hypothetical protein